MVPKRKSEEQDGYAVGMGDSKKKKPKGPGIALVIAIGHKGKHDKDAMKKAWSVLKDEEDDLQWDPVKNRHTTPEDRASDARVQADLDAQHNQNQAAIVGRLGRALGIPMEDEGDQEGHAEHERLQHDQEGHAEHEHLAADRENYDQHRAEEFAPRPPPPPQLPDYKSGFADDYDPDAKEKDAGF